MQPTRHYSLGSKLYMKLKYYINMCAFPFGYPVYVELVY